MGIDVTVVFIQTALGALNDNIWRVTEQQREEMCDKLIEMCKEYAPGTFKKREETTSLETKE